MSLFACHFVISGHKKLKVWARVASKSIMFIPYLLKLVNLLKSLNGTHRKHGDFISILFPSIKESRLKINYKVKVKLTHIPTTSL